MKFSVAYNGDLDLIHRLSEYKSVKHIYGVMSNNQVGSGRRMKGLPPLGQENIEQAVRIAKQYGMEFNYLINGSCMGNREYYREERYHIEKLLDWIDGIGVTWITVANPIILQLCKKKHPKLKISLSSFANVDNVERAKYFIDMGVDEITVRENINREFSLLERLSQLSSCEMQVLANQTCLYQCPLQFYHDNVMSHGSLVLSTDEKNDLPLDQCMFFCTYKKFSNPQNLIKARWIRPEDLSIYKKYGIHKFKITDRIKSTDWLVKVVGAYHQQRYPGNLADILNIIPFKDKRSAGVLQKGIHFNVDRNFRNAAVALLSMHVFIDNQGLDGFIKPFTEQSCQQKDCNTCQYCRKVGEKVLSFNAETATGVAVLRKQLSYI